MAAAAIRSGWIQACVWVRDVSCVMFQILWVWQKPRHILSSSFSPSFFKPVWIREKCGPSDSHSFSPNSTKSCLGRARKGPSSKSSLFHQSLLTISVSPPHHFDILQTGQAFSFLCAVALAPWAWNVLPIYPLLCPLIPAPQAQTKDGLLHEGFLHHPTCK